MTQEEIELARNRRERARWHATVDIDPRTGLVRDGARIRVPMPMMDAANPSPLRTGVVPITAAASAAVPMHIRTNPEIRRDLHRHFYRDGTPRPKRKPVADVAPVADSMPVADAADPYASNRPGFRFSDTADADAGVTAKRTAYDAMTLDLSQQWMSKERRLQHDAELARATADAAPDGVDAREWARAKMIEDTVWKGGTNPTDAMSFLQKTALENRFWQTRDITPKNTEDAVLAREQGIRELNDAWRGKQDAAAAVVKPVGKWTKESGLRVGSPCSFDGQLGTIQEGADGLLYCETRALESPRVPATNPSSADAVPPRFMDAATAQKIKDAAYNEMVTELTNQWKTPA
jgi:hypothetical protein